MDKSVGNVEVDLGIEGTYAKGHGHGQEHEQDFAESSTCASVAIPPDPSRVACFTSTNETILTTTTDDHLSEHDALDAPMIPDFESPRRRRRRSRPRPRPQRCPYTSHRGKPKRTPKPKACGKLFRKLSPRSMVEPSV